MTEQAYYQQLAEAVGAGESDLISKIFEDVFFPAIPFPFYRQKLLQTNPVRY